MNQLLLYLIIFILAYLIDLSTALLHRRMRPNNFRSVEANEKFRRCLEQKGILKGVGAYMILSLTETIILFISVIAAAYIIFGSTIIEGVTFTLLLLTIVHALGTITNLLALFKKDRVPKKPMINVNNLNWINKKDAINTSSGDNTQNGI